MSDTEGVRSALADVRTSKGMLQEQLAEAAGVTSRTIRRIETDPGYSPGVDTLASLARALDVELADLLVIRDDHDADGNGSANGVGQDDQKPVAVSAKRSATGSK